MADNLSQQALDFIRRHDLIRPGQHVLVAVSGGADSVALLYVLRELKRQFRLRLTVAHLNHKIRGRAADEDARFVKQLARRLHLDFAGGMAAVPRLAGRLGISLEMAGRRARYSFLEKTALARGCHLVATAHTADDNAETILLMLARGCGLQGLTGIAPSSQIGKTTVIRPFLGIERRAIERYLRERNIAWREDISNADPAFLRNRVRHELLPLLEAKYNKGIRRALINLADVLRGENEFMEAFAAAVYAEACDESGRVLNCAIAAKHHSAVRRRVLRHWLKTNGIQAGMLDFQTINKLDGLLMNPARGRSLELAGGIIIRRNYQWLAIEEQRTEPNGNFSHKIRIPGRTMLPEARLIVRAELGSGADCERAVFGKFPVRASVSLKKLGHKQILARSWRPGDRMRPYGLAGSKKIQDIFSDAKFPAVMRRRLPIFECGGEIIWIPGYRIAEGWQVPGAAAKALHLTVE